MRVLRMLTMPIYTRTGDRGTTSLYNGKRVSKSNVLVEAYGTVDELTSYIGLVSPKIKDKKDQELLVEIQKDLYRIMGVLSGSKLDLKYLDKRILGFERTIDGLDRKLPKLKRFILPGGNENSSLFHVLRVVCRRAERNVVSIKQPDDLIVKYLNRLSDLFFTMARKYGPRKEIVL